jgi:membrane-associated phospholipid phosphatase
MSWESSFVLHFNHWALNHKTFVTFLANESVYVALAVSALVITYCHFRNFGQRSFEAQSLWQSFKFGVNHLVAPVAIAVAISEWISKIYIRPRPFVSIPGVHALFRHGADGGMPSHHTVFMVALALCIGHYSRNWSIALVILAIIGGIFRIAAGVHYPTDVVAGIFIGFLVPYLARELRNYLEARRR